MLVKRSLIYPFSLRNGLFALSLYVVTYFSVVSAQEPGNTANDPYWTTGSNQVGDCGSSYNFGSCTANDFRITNLAVSNVVDACSSDTDYMQADLTVTFSKGQPIRYDVMSYFYRGEESGVAFDLTADAADNGGWCTRVGIENNLEIFKGGATGSFTDDIDGDETAPASGVEACFDVPNGNQNGTMSQTQLGIVLPCRDGDANGIVDIAACTGWSQSADPANCSGPEYDGVTEPQNGTGSKCNCAQYDTDPAVTLPDVSVAKLCEGDDTVGNGTNSPDVDGKYYNGDVVQCTITISNASGAGTLDGATSASTEGFFYVDDYDEARGAISSVVVNNPGGGSPTSSDDTPSVGMLSVYPDDIAGGDDVVITYLYTISSTATGGLTEVDISNTVCLNYYDTSNGGTTTADADEAAGDCAVETITTTPVTLVDFNVHREAGGLQFDWVTATETNNIGFNLYAAFGASLFRINADLIPSQQVSTLEASIYAQWLDAGQYSRAKEFYLEDVDIRGASVKHGPFKLSSPNSAMKSLSPIKNASTNWLQVKSKNKRSYAKRSKAKNKAKSNSNNKNKAKSNSNKLNDIVEITLSEAGLQRVNLGALSDAGFSSGDIAKGRYLLTDSRGEKVPSHVIKAEGEDYLVFVGLAERGFYSTDSIYQLKHAKKINSALEMALVGPGNGTVAAEYYTHTEVIDDDNRYVNTSKVHQDPWMIDRIFAIRNPATTSYSVPVSDVFQGVGATNAVVAAELVGGVDFPNEIDHKIELYAGAEFLNVLEFDGASTAQIQGELSMAEVSDELNVALKLTGVNSIGVSIAYPNKISVTYPRRFVAIDNQLNFTSEGAYFNVEGFTDARIHVYAKSGGAVIYMGEFSGQDGVVSFPGVADAKEYILFGESTVSEPALSVKTPRNLIDLHSEHLVITNELFYGAELDEYLLEREAFSEGSSTVVTVDEIYTLYSGGVRDAEAIYSYIKEYAKVNALNSVLIVGGDVYDYHDNLGIGAQSHVPTLYRATGVLDLIQYAPVDSMFGDIDDDGVPDVPVGRLPVRTVEEMIVLLNKMKIYAANRGDTTATLISDAQRDDSEYDFAASSDSLGNILQQKGWSITKAYIDDLGVVNARATLIDSLNSGPRLALYTGHSAPSTWSADKIFSYQDALELLNVNSPSAYVQWGCYNTYFSSPYSDSMSHGLMLAGKQGAAIVIGSSTLTDAVAESEFAELFQQEIVHGEVSYGDAFIKAKQRFAATGGLSHKDILWGVTLLGDPLLAL